MAIQINERDNQIFNLIDEHKVLLEKHISYFIANDSTKPVLIRDRLRKLFYLDYLRCKKFDLKISWWTTPSKPIIYSLTGLSKEVLGNVEVDYEDISADIEKHYLEIANLRMLHHIAQNNGKISNLKWKIVNNDIKFSGHFDSIANYLVFNKAVSKGIINCHDVKKMKLDNIKNDINHFKVDEVLIVFQNESDMEKFGFILNNDSELEKFCNFTTHQLIYKDITNLENNFNNNYSLISKFAVA